MRFSRSSVLKSTPIDDENGLIGWWPLNDPGALDYSGRGLIGVPASGITPELVVSGSGYRFDGSGQDVRLPTNIFASNVLTVELSFTARSVNAFKAIFSIYVDDSNCMEIFVNDSNSQLAGGTRANWAFSAASSIAAGLTYRVALVSDGSITTFYLNGVASGTTGIPGFNGTAQAFNAYIARRNFGAMFWFDGSVQDVRCYNRARTPAELFASYSRAWAGNQLMPDEWEMPILQPQAAVGSHAPYYYRQMIARAA